MVSFHTDISVFRSLSIALAAAACATSTRSAPSATSQDRPFVHSIWQIIAAPEIAGACALNAFDLISSRRPQYLTDPSRDIAKRLPSPAVYINGAHAGDIVTLSRIPANTLVEVRYLPPRDAVANHGSSSARGEILLYTYDPKKTAPRPCLSSGQVTERIKRV